MAALDSYRSERETAMAGKDKIIESLAEEVEEKERAKVKITVENAIP